MADNTPKVRPQAGKTLGQSGTQITGGIISLEEYNRKLVGKAAIRQYDIMRRSDSTIRSTLQVVKLPLLGAKWSVQPAHIDEDTEGAETLKELAKYKARFVERELMKRNVNWQTLLKSLMSALEFGYDVEEKVYELTEFEGDVRIGLAKIDKRKQTTILKWEDDKGNPGITQQIIGTTAYIPMDKLIVVTHDREGENYEGISLLRYVYKDWDIKDKLTIVNAMSLEQLGMGVPHIKEHEGQTANETDKQKAIDSVRNFRANEERYIMTPSSMDFEMVDMKSNSVKEIIPTLNYHDRRISQSILAQFMDLGGSAGSGSQSLSTDLTSLFMKSEQALSNLLISALQEQLVKQLCDLNFSDMSEGYPQLTCSNLADDDIEVLATATSNLVTAGALTPEATLEDHLRELLSFPQLPEEIKENYKEYKQPTAPAAPATPTDDVSNKEKSDLEKTDPEKAAVNAAQSARRKLIDVIYEG